MNELRLQEELKEDALRVAQYFAKMELRVKDKI